MKPVSRLSIHKPLGIALLVATALLAIAVSSRLVDFDLRSRASYKPARIEIDAATLPGRQISPDFMLSFAQGGEEKADMIGPVSGVVAGLTPKIIRIDHIYDAYEVVTPSGYDFSRLDTAVKSIVKAGATPMLSLSYMPPGLSADGSLTGLPASWNEWSSLVRQTVERYSGKNSLNINGLYYEVWNEPDLAQFGGFKTYGGKNYLELYRASAQGAAKAVNTNPFLFGGPATTGLYKAWIDALIMENTRIDFLSWHVYSDDPGKPAEDVARIRSWLAANEKFRNIPLIISELGFESGKDERYSGRFAAAYTAAAFRFLLDNPPHAVMSFELKDGPGEDRSGWGMITHESKGGIRKARYYVYPFLAGIKGNLLSVTGEGTNIVALAVRNGASITIMLVNYHASFAKSETAPVSIRGLNNGSYRVQTQYLLGADNTSVHTVTDGTLRLVPLLTPYSVVRIDISPV